MARVKSNSNGRLKKAMDALAEAHRALALAQATVPQTLATLAQTQAATLPRRAELDVQYAERNSKSVEYRVRTEECFKRIEAILMEHTRLLRALPDAVLEKIGFKVPVSRPAE